MSPQTCLRTVWWRHFLSWGFFFTDNSNITSQDILEAGGRRIVINQRPTWVKYWVPGQSRLHSGVVSSKELKQDHNIIFCNLEMKWTRFKHTTAQFSAKHWESESRDFLTNYVEFAHMNKGKRLQGRGDPNNLNHSRNKSWFLLF